jgi:hypothetical protein
MDHVLCTRTESQKCQQGNFGQYVEGPRYVLPHSHLTTLTDIGMNTNDFNYGQTVGPFCERVIEAVADNYRRSSSHHSFLPSFQAVSSAKSLEQTDGSQPLSARGRSPVHASAHCRQRRNTMLFAVCSVFSWEVSFRTWSLGQLLTPMLMFL